MAYYKVRILETKKYILIRTDNVIASYDKSRNGAYMGKTEYKTKSAAKKILGGYSQMKKNAG